MTKKQERQCAHAATLSGSERWAYQEEHDITSSMVWTYKQKHKDIRQTRTKRKKTRIRALATQGGLCALCEEQITPDRRCCLDKSGKVVCNSCNLFLTKYRKLRTDGVSHEDMKVFEAQTGTGTQIETHTEPVWHAGAWVDPITWDPLDPQPVKTE